MCTRCSLGKLWSIHISFNEFMLSCWVPPNNSKHLYQLECHEKEIMPRKSNRLCQGKQQQDYPINWNATENSNRLCPLWHNSFFAHRLSRRNRWTLRGTRCCMLSGRRELRRVSLKPTVKRMVDLRQPINHLYGLDMTSCLLQDWGWFRATCSIAKQSMCLDSWRKRHSFCKWTRFV